MAAIRAFTALVCLTALACADPPTEPPPVADVAAAARVDGTDHCTLGGTTEALAAEIAELRAHVDALESAGILNSGQARALRNHLDVALDHLRAGRSCPAVASLRAFRAQVRNFVAAGVLPPLDAAPLLEGVGRALGDIPEVVEARLSVGMGHVCALSSSGSAYCWGLNNSGEIGDGTMTVRTSPVPVAGGLAFGAISAGGNHTCALTRSGAAYCWGMNLHGQLGNGNGGLHAFSTTPQLVLGNHTFIELSVGADHSCGRTASGALYCWGYNFYGQLGDGTGSGTWEGTSHDRHTPTRVQLGVAAASVSPGGYHTCALSLEGTTYCWGYNEYGQLGDGTSAHHPLPAAVPGEWRAVRGGGFFTCALTPEGRGQCWGNNFHGQLGDGNAAENLFESTPVPLADTRVWSALAPGTEHSCALDPAGAAYCWGSGAAGQLGHGGDGTSASRSIPTAVDSELLWESIAAGQNSTCAMTPTAALYCWGRLGVSLDYLGIGQLGASTPMPVLGWTTLP